MNQREETCSNVYCDYNCGSNRKPNPPRQQDLRKRPMMTPTFNRGPRPRSGYGFVSNPMYKPYGNNSNKQSENTRGGRQRFKPK